MFCLHSCFSLSLYPWIKPEDLCHPQRFQEMPSMWLVCTANAHGMWDIPAWAQRAPHWSRRLPASRQKWWISMELLLHFWVDMEAILYLPRIPWFHSGFGWVFVKLLKPYWFPPSTLLSLKRALEFPRKHLGVSMCFFSTRKSKQENSSLLWNKIYIYISRSQSWSCEIVANASVNQYETSWNCEIKPACLESPHDWSKL